MTFDRSNTVRLSLALVLVCGTAASLAGDDGAAACLDAHTQGAKAAAKVPGFDDQTGKDLRNYPPHRDADLQHMRLEVMIPDMNIPKFTATQTLTFQPLGVPLETLTLDARSMTVTSVAMVGHETKFAHDGRKLAVTFSPAIAPTEKVELVTSYSVDDPPLGLIWTPESPAWRGRAAQIHTQGQPETNSFWFPCRDFPNERMSTELTATVPAGFLVTSNGRLAEQRRDIITGETPAGTRTMHPYDTFHWVQEKPHVAYLVTMVVGKFDVVDIGGSGVSMPVYVPPGRGKDVQGSFGRTKDMVAFFESVTGQRYPWDKYAQLCVYNFASGGMENTSATSLYDTCVVEPSALMDHDPDGLISHELAHQWFGDLATCNSWEHLWLNEGFATYMTGLWFEHRDGADKYTSEMINHFDNLAAGDHPDAPTAQPMVSKVYEHPWEVFRKPANPYGKGAAILHMLRAGLGDDVFFKGVQLYMDRRKLNTAETGDLRTALEETSGRNLERFFAQWCLRPGVPHLDITPEWDSASGTMTVNVEQIQNIDGDNPAFEFELPVLFQFNEGGKWTTSAGTIPVNGRSTKWTMTLANEPATISFDPTMTVLAKLITHQDDQHWMTLVGSGANLYSRVQACRGIGMNKGVMPARMAEALRRMACDVKQPVQLRKDVIAALVARGDRMDVRSIATTAVDHWEVRVATTNALADLMDQAEFKENSSMRESTHEFLAARAMKDKSIKVRCAALKAVARLHAEDAATPILACLKMDSQSDELRQAALEALGELQPNKALQQAVVYSTPGHDTRTRPVATTTVGKLASQDKDLALKTLTTLLYDRELRTQRAAGEAMVASADPRAAAELEKAIAGARSEEHRQMYEGWLKDLKEKSAAK